MCCDDVFPLEQRPGLLALDDLMWETADSDQLMDLLSKGAHHLNLFVTAITQNLYAPGKHVAGMNRNYQYTVLFRNPADTHWSFMPLYEWATTVPHGYLVVDHHPKTLEEICFCFNILLEEAGFVRVLRPIKQH